MKRALLFGIAVHLLVFGFGPILGNFVVIGETTLSRAASIATGLAMLLAGIAVVLVARRFEKSPSNFVNSAGWALGFWVPVAVAALVILVAYLAGFPIKQISL